MKKMKQWSRQIDINAPIEHVWDLLNDPNNMKKIMPRVEEHKLVKETEEGVGTIYRQSYREGSKVMEYDVETLEYQNDPNEKKLKVGFNLANMFEITAKYELVKIDDQKTSFTYTTTNTPLTLLVKITMFFMRSDKVVVDFVNRVKNIAEASVEE